MNIRKKLWEYCPKPIKRTGPYIVKACVRIQKEMVPSKRMKWLAISGYVALLLFIWLDYFLKLTGYANPEGALLYTLGAPLVTFAGFKIYKVKSLKFWQWEWSLFGAFVFGFAIWSAITFLLNRVLSSPGWAEAPLIQPFLTLAISYVTGAYLGYRFGKKRGFIPLIF
jgi:hypothetical protein